MDDLVKLFITHKILAEDDKEVFSLAPSEHLKNQYLLECLWHFKLSVWSVICDILVNTASMTCVGNQVLEGRGLFINCYVATYVCTYFLHIYVCML